MNKTEKQPFHHVCTCCGACCRQQPGETCTLMIYPSELARVAAACGMDAQTFAKTRCMTEYMELSGVEIPVLTVPFEDNHCIFLNDRNRCDIYADRPYQCRMFDEGYFAAFILAERNIPCVAGMELPEDEDEGNEKEYALAMELLNGYPVELP